MRLLTTVVLAGLSLVLVGGAGTAHACSCDIVTPRGALEGSDMAFIGVLTEIDVADDPFSEPAALVFDVETVFAGDVSETQVAYHQLGTSCSVDHSPKIGLEVVVFTYFADGRQNINECAGLSDDGSLLSIADVVPEATGAGTPTMLVAGSYGSSELVVLDEFGNVVTSGQLDAPVDAVSHCEGTAKAAVNKGERLAIVDLDAMAEVEVLGEAFWGSQLDVQCQEAGEVVIVSERNSAKVTSHAGGEQTVRELPSEAFVVTTGVDTPISVLSIFRGAGIPLEVIDNRTLEPVGWIGIEATEVPVAAAFDRSAQRIAVLMDLQELGQGYAPFDFARLHLAIFELRDDWFVRQPDVSLTAVSGSSVSAPSVEWVDESTLALNGLGEDRVEFVQTIQFDGTVGEPSTSANWQTSAVVAQDGSLWRVNGNGVEVIDTDEAVRPTQLLPTRGPTGLVLAPLFDPPPLTPRSVEPFASRAPVGGSVSEGIPSAPAEVVDDRADDVVELPGPERETTASWARLPFIVTAGLAVVLVVLAAATIRQRRRV